MIKVRKINIKKRGMQKKSDELICCRSLSRRCDVLRLPGFLRAALLDLAKFRFSRRKEFCGILVFYLVF